MSSLFALLCFLVIIFAFAYFIIPQLVVSLPPLLQNLPAMIDILGKAKGFAQSVLLLLMTDPGKCVIFLIFIVVLQQVDGNIIGPKILGDSTGLSAFRVLFSLLLFSHFMGFWGMLLGVPLFASFYYLFREFIDGILRKKKLPVSTEEYVDVVSVSPGGVLVHAEPRKVRFPALFWGEDSLENRRRRKKAFSEQAKADASGDQDGPLAEQSDAGQAENAEDASERRKE